MANKTDIWTSSFSSGKEIAGTPFKTGVITKSVKSSLNTAGRSTIAYSVTNAIVALISGSCSIGKNSDHYWCECKSRNLSDRRYVTIYYPTSKRFEFFVAENGQGYDYKLATDGFSHWSIFIPRIVQLIEEDPMGEFADSYSSVLDLYNREGAITNSAKDHMFLLNDYLYCSRHEFIQNNSEVVEVVPREDIMFKDITDMFTKIPSDFHFAKTAAAVASANIKAKSKKNGKAAGSSKQNNLSFKLDWSQPLTQEEEALIPNFDLSVMKISKEINKVVRMVKEEQNSYAPVNNIIFYGEGGSGKTTGAKIAAQLWGIPYRFINLSLNSEESDLTGIFKPKADGTFEFFEPAFAQTFRNGGVIELMEINYARPGALGVLNSAMDDTGMITLGNGEVVKRHPNCVIIATTNVDYAGCQKMNAAMKDRFQQIALINKMPSDELVEIAMRCSGFDRRDTVIKLVDAVEKISIKMVEEQITGGVCSTRQLINWARDIKYTSNVIESAKSTVLPGVSLDLEVQQDIIDTILKPMF